MRVAQLVAYLESNQPQTRDNGSHSKMVAGVEAMKGSRVEVDLAHDGNPGSVAGAEATDQNSAVGRLCRKEKERPEKWDHKDQRSRT